MNLQTLAVLVVALVAQVLVGKFVPEQTQVAGILSTITLALANRLLGQPKAEDEKLPEKPEGE